MTHFTSFIKCLSKWLLVGTVLSYSFVVCYWLWWPYEVLVVEEPIEIVNPGKIVQAGDMVAYRIKYEKKMDVPGTLTRKLVNTYKLEYADVTTTAPPGKDDDTIFLLIPTFAHSGEHYLRWSIAYKVNPLRTVTVNAESERFMVMGVDIAEGKQGIQGPIGKTGPKGDTGEKGEKGEKGNGFWGEKIK